MTISRKKVAEKVCKLCGVNIFGRMPHAQYCKKCARRRWEIMSQVHGYFKRHGYIKGSMIAQARKYGIVKYIETNCMVELNGGKK